MTMAAISVLAGCMTPRQYQDSIVEQLRDPSRRTAAIVDCSERLKVRIDANERQAAAEIMQVKPSRVPWTFCDRLGSAVARGEVSADEFSNATSGGPSDATLEHLVQVLTTPGFSEPQGASAPILR